VLQIRTLRETIGADMNNQIKQAYGLGRKYAMIRKQASSAASAYTQPSDLNRMLLGAAIGGGSGALIGGRYNRKSGAIGGALAGAIAANPQLFLALIGQGAGTLYDFANGKWKG
jgi:hypothetical protein